MNLKILVLASNRCGQTRCEVGAESDGSLQVLVAAGLAKFLSEKDSRAAQYEIVKVM